jgi:hypothetical protein
MFLVYHFYFLFYISMMYNLDNKAVIDKTDIIIDILNPDININKKHKIGTELFPTIKKVLFDDLGISPRVKSKILVNNYLYSNKNKTVESNIGKLISITGKSCDLNRRMVRDMLSNYGGYELSFSFVVKKICAVLYGLSPRLLLYPINKDTELKYLKNYTPRELLTHVGNFIRSSDGLKLSEEYGCISAGLYGSEHWSPITKYIANLIIDIYYDKQVILSDVRYNDEYLLATLLNFYKIKLVDPPNILCDLDIISNRTLYDTTISFGEYHYNNIMPIF